MTAHVAKWWERTADGRVRCHLCPRLCTLRDGQRGFCFVRRNQDGKLVLDTYGRSSGFAVDPVEKKPLNHFLPGSHVFSFGTGGCNLACKFCQNWTVSTSREFDSLGQRASPKEIAYAARRFGAKSVAFTYNDPIIFAEYAIETANACKSVGVHPIAVSAGYVSDTPRKALYGSMSAANIDLKGFTEEFYRKTTGAHLQTVLDTLEYIRGTDCWLEITTLLVPGRNDSDQEVRAMSRWIVQNLGRDIPHHFSAFHPAHRMMDVPPTPPKALLRAREIALAEGEQYVYTGNIYDPSGQSTYCPGCGTKVIERDRYQILSSSLHVDGEGQGTCGSCRASIPGVFA